MSGEAPPSASARRYLSSTLPAVYRTDEDAFVLRLLHALEEVLDPTVTLIDNLAWHIDPRMAPPDLVAALFRWFGLRLDEALPTDAQRRLLTTAMVLSRRRGTLAGLRLTLRAAFPELELEATHTGVVSTGADPRERPAAPEPRIEVRAGRPLDERQREAVERLLVDQCPVGVPWELA
ncbi:MAG TPA: phage tail protein [Solirubrobacteraceae bacterium]